MAKYRAARNLFVDNVFVDEGSDFKSSGKPGKHWTPLDEEAKERVKNLKPVPADEPEPTSPDPDAPGTDEIDPDESEKQDGKVYADGPVEEVEGKHYATVDGLQFEVDPRNVRDDLSLTNAGVQKYEAAKAE